LVRAQETHLEVRVACLELLILAIERHVLRRVSWWCKSALRRLLIVVLDEAGCMTLGNLETWFLHLLLHVVTVFPHFLHVPFEYVILCYGPCVHFVAFGDIVCQLSLVTNLHVSFSVHRLERIIRESFSGGMLLASIRPVAGLVAVVLLGVGAHLELGSLLLSFHLVAIDARSLRNWVLYVG
jgi:hypothetical protein